MLTVRAPWLAVEHCPRCLALRRTAVPLHAAPPPRADADADPDAVVRRLIDAFNDRDLDALLACLDPDVDLHPLPFRGLRSSYRGHTGVGRWLRDLRREQHEHRLDPVGLRVLGAAEARVLTVGRVHDGARETIERFCAVHVITGGRIRSARHVVADAEMLRRPWEVAL